jgi:hypothetical protein
MEDIHLDVYNWLRSRMPGFSSLRESEIRAISQFSLMWTYFESVVFHCEAAANSFEPVVQSWQANGLLTGETFEKSLEYFRHRYASNGKVNVQFSSLHFRPRDRQELVGDVLVERRTSSSDVAEAMLIIVYRLRNNLFHGKKWESGIANQLENFEHAVRVMKTAIELNEKCASAL